MDGATRCNVSLVTYVFSALPIEASSIVESQSAGKYVLCAINTLLHVPTFIYLSYSEPVHQYKCNYSLTF